MEEGEWRRRRSGALQCHQIVSNPEMEIYSEWLFQNKLK